MPSPNNKYKSKRARLEEYYKNPNVQAYLAGIRFTETGGTGLNWDAKNPKSTARGPYQFLDSSQKDILNNWGVNAYSKDPKEVHLAALGLMAYKPQGLESIKKGDFKKADTMYNKYWTSLPGGAEPNVHTPKLRDVRAKELSRLTKPVAPKPVPAPEPGYFEKFMTGYNAPFNDPKTDYNFPTRFIGGLQEVFGIDTTQPVQKQKHGGRLTKKGKKRRKYGPRPDYMNQNPNGMTTGPITQRSIGNTPGGGYMAFADGGNTAYESWYRYNTPEGREGLPESYSSYDYQRYYNDAVRGLNPMGFDEGSQHFPDTYKYPWHPSFSDESIYYTNQKETPALSYNTKADWKEYTRSKRSEGGWTGYPDHTMYSSAMQQFDDVRRLSKYADGGPIEPYNISDPTEFKKANQAYQDSLGLYNQTQKFLEAKKFNDKIALITMGTTPSKAYSIPFENIPATGEHNFPVMLEMPPYNVYRKTDFPFKFIESTRSVTKSDYAKKYKNGIQPIGWYTQGADDVHIYPEYKKPVRKPVYTPEPEYNITQSSEPMGPQNMEMPTQVDSIWTPYGKMSRADYEKQFGSKVTERDLRVKKDDGGDVSQAQQEYIRNIGRNAATGSVTPLYGAKDPIFTIIGGAAGRVIPRMLSLIPSPTKSAATKSEQLPEIPKNRAVPPPHKGSELSPELEPYMSSTRRPATREEQVFESFLSPKRRAELDEERTTYYDSKGNIIPRPKKAKGGKVTWQIIK